jgi:hypothetical protein
MITQQNQTLLDVAVLETGTALSVFDYAFVNNISITSLLDPGTVINDIPKKQYEAFEFYELVQKYIDKRSDLIAVIENQSLMDIAVQSDGCVLAVFDYAFANSLSITDVITPGQKLKQPSTTLFRYNDLANYFKDSSKNITTYKFLPSAEPNVLEYLFPGEFPLSF